MMENVFTPENVINPYAEDNKDKKSDKKGLASRLLKHVQNTAASAMAAAILAGAVLGGFSADASASEAVEKKGIKTEETMKDQSPEVAEAIGDLRTFIKEMFPKITDEKLDRIIGNIEIDMDEVGLTDDSERIAYIQATKEEFARRNEEKKSEVSGEVEFNGKNFKGEVRIMVKNGAKLVSFEGSHQMGAKVSENAKNEFFKKDYLDHYAGGGNLTQARYAMDIAAEKLLQYKEAAEAADAQGRKDLGDVIRHAMEDTKVQIVEKYGDILK